MEFGVAYLLTNATCAARLVVSLDSLRRWYDGPVVVFTTNAEAACFVDLCRADSRLGIQHTELRLSFDASCKNGSYLAKVELPFSFPFKHTVFLDADTLIVKDPIEFFRATTRSPLTVVQFANWLTTDTHRRQLLEKWRDVSGGESSDIPIQKLVDISVSVPLPAINTGVFGLEKNSPILSEWQTLAFAGRRLPIPDELSLQLLLPKTEHQLFDASFNACPIYCTKSSAHIWHFIGGMHLRDSTARSIWMPAYSSCCRRNVARIADWTRIET